MSKISYIKLRSIKYLLFFIFALAFLISGCAKNSLSSPEPQTWGQVDATEVDMNSKIAGRVVELYVKEGNLVKKGQILACIDARELIAKQSQAEAQLRAAKATALQAKASMDLAGSDLNRYEVLYQQGAISSQSYDVANTKYQVASAAYSQALEGVAAAQEQVQQVSVNVDETLIKAPFDGIITTKYVNVGAMVSSGMPIVAIQNPDDNWVNIKIKETELDKYHVGQTLQLEGRNDKYKIKGKVVDISNKPNFATTRATSERGDVTDIISFNIKIQINSKDIRPGMRFKIDEGDGNV